MKGVHKISKVTLGDVAELLKGLQSYDAFVDCNGAKLRTRVFKANDVQDIINKIEKTMKPSAIR